MNKALVRSSEYIKEIVQETSPENWPPKTIKQIMRFFLEKEQQDPATYKGFGDCANEVVRQLVFLSQVMGGDSITEYINKPLSLPVKPEFADEPSSASEVLTFAAYSLTDAKLTYSRDDPGKNGYHVEYDGEFHQVPVTFSESYKLREDGSCESMNWSVRLNRAPVEEVESEILRSHPVGTYREEPLILHLILDKTLNLLPITEEPEILRAA